MAQLISFSFPPKAYVTHKPSASLSKEWLPSLDVKVTTNIPALNKKRAVPISVVCSLGGDGTTSTTVKEPEAVPADVVLGRSSFPPNFIFGTASSAYQIEGAWNEGGRKPSIWDTFTHNEPHKIKGRDNGDVAIDSYHRYEEDIQRMKEMGVDSYRFSISWSRILPDGTGRVNPEGVKYYNKLINTLRDNGITPYVTLFHWDVPQALEDKYQGFLNSEITDDFANYAKVCFMEFGDRVKHWITLNEPWTFSILGYCLGRHAPGRCTPEYFSYPETCPAGNSSTESYTVSHNLILAHAKAAKLYKDHFQALQRGEIGVTLSCTWYKPLRETPQDRDAVQRSLEFMLGWYMDPLFTGDYPYSMKAILKEKLPSFTEDEANMIKGSYDFIGMNYYSTRYAFAFPYSSAPPPLAIFDSHANTTGEKDGIPIGALDGSWLYVYPDGVRDLLLYIKDRYNNPTIYITENGTVEINKPDTPIEEALCDKHRVEYLSSHFAQIRQAMRDGANVKAYFQWSLTDNFEWHEGYGERFGLYYVDYNDGLKRYPKSSVNYYTKFLHT